MGTLDEFVLCGLFLHSFKKFSFPWSISRQFRNIRWIWDMHFDYFVLFFQSNGGYRKTGSGLSDAVFASSTSFSVNGLYNIHVRITNSCMNSYILPWRCIYQFFDFQFNWFCSFWCFWPRPTQKFQKFHPKLFSIISVQQNKLHAFSCYLRRSVIPKVTSWKRNEILPSFCNFRYRNLFDNHSFSTRSHVSKL